MFSKLSAIAKEIDDIKKDRGGSSVQSQEVLENFSQFLSAIEGQKGAHDAEFLNTLGFTMKDVRFIQESQQLLEPGAMKTLEQRFKAVMGSDASSSSASSGKHSQEPSEVIESFDKVNNDLIELMHSRPDLRQRVVLNLDAQIQRVYEDSLPSEEFLGDLEQVFEDVKACLRRSPSFQARYGENSKEQAGKQWLGYELYMYGSAISSLVSRRSSDLDMTLLVTSHNMDHRAMLGDVMSVLRVYGDHDDVTSRGDDNVSSKKKRKEQRYHFDKNMPRQDTSGWIL